jgi:hypothetical protein
MLDDICPAFPTSRVDCDEGMTIREWYAGMALQGILANPLISPAQSLTKMETRVRCEAAFEYADAMMRANKKRDL